MVFGVPLRTEHICLVYRQKPPNRSSESKAKTAAKRSMQPKAVKIWEALKYHIDKGVSIMSDIDDIPGLHAYIGENEGTKKAINDLTARGGTEQL